jgi:hypothetical protein
LIIHIARYATSTYNYDKNDVSNDKRHYRNRNRL